LSAKIGEEVSEGAKKKHAETVQHDDDDAVVGVKSNQNT
jgi:hypothetical protein